MRRSRRGATRRADGHVDATGRRAAGGRRGHPGRFGPGRARRRPGRRRGDRRHGCRPSAGDRRAVPARSWPRCGPARTRAVPGLPLTEVVKEVRPAGAWDARPGRLAAAGDPPTRPDPARLPGRGPAGGARGRGRGRRGLRDGRRPGGRVVVLPGEPANTSRHHAGRALDRPAASQPGVQREGEPDEHGAARLSAVR